MLRSILRQRTALPLPPRPVVSLPPGRAIERGRTSGGTRLSGHHALASRLAGRALAGSVTGSRRPSAGCSSTTTAPRLTLAGQHAPSRLATRSRRHSRRTGRDRACLMGTLRAERARGKPVARSPRRIVRRPGRGVAADSAGRGAPAGRADPRPLRVTRRKDDGDGRRHGRHRRHRRI